MYLTETIGQDYINYIKTRESFTKQNDALNKGELAVDTLFTPDGSKIDMQDAIAKYKGKYVYVDFWASWCGPCREAMPQSLKLKQQMGDAMEFIYISTDENFSAWTQAMKKENLDPSRCYLISNKSQFVKLKKITSIPRYMLFDDQGKIVDDNCFTPHEADFVKKMNDIINK